MFRLTPFVLLLSGCMSVDMGTPVSFPSACWGDINCQRNLNAQTLHYLGHSIAATELMCEDHTVRNVMEDECGNILQYP